MPTEHSWTEIRAGVANLRALLQFRSSGLTDRTRRRLRWGAGFVALMTLSAILVPAYLQEPLNSRRVGSLVGALPSFYVGFLVLSLLAAVASGGGREVVPRDQVVGYPISSVTEHFGALLLAPLNIAWLIQAWALLGATSYVLGPHRVLFAAVPILAWILFATAAGQAVGWIFEGIRRMRFGILGARLITLAAAGGVASLMLTHRLTDVLDRSPTVQVYLAASYATGGAWLSWARITAEVLVLAAVAILVGLVPARWALLRPQREELRLESGVREARPNPRSDLAAMVRPDRASIWRAVPLRRGLLVLGFMPGAVALAGHLEWDLITVLPGLVASGGALLFGVNAWCLDGRGALWRESLPVSPGVAFVAKVVVLFEVLLTAALLTIVLAAVRAGTPTAAQLVSIVAATLVVSAHVVAAALRWSVSRPFAVDMRSARATPAPPVAMAGYSARLAVSTTMLGLVFSGTSLASDWRVPVLAALPLLCWSGYRLAGTAAAWNVPETRARVVAVVAT